MNDKRVGRISHKGHSHPNTVKAKAECRAEHIAVADERDRLMSLARGSVKSAIRTKSPTIIQEATIHCGQALAAHTVKAPHLDGGFGVLPAWRVFSESNTYKEFVALRDSLDRKAKDLPAVPKVAAFKGKDTPKAKWSEVLPRTFRLDELRNLIDGLEQIEESAVGNATIETLRVVVDLGDVRVQATHDGTEWVVEVQR